MARITVTSQKVVLGYFIISSIKSIVKRLSSSQYVDFYYEIYSPDSSRLRLLNGVSAALIASFLAELRENECGHSLVN